MVRDQQDKIRPSNTKLKEENQELDESIKRNGTWTEKDRFKPQECRLQLVGVGFPFHNGCEEAGTTLGCGRRAERSVRVRTRGAERCGRGEENGG